MLHPRQLGQRGLNHNQGGRMKLVRFVAGMAGMAVLATPTLASADPGQQDEGPTTLVEELSPYTTEDSQTPLSGDADGYLAGWNEVKAKTSGSREETPSMRDQMYCHIDVVRLRAPNKTSWNLDTWRPNVSYAKMLAEQCNP